MIEEKLDLLAEYHSQRDSIEAQKLALLDDVKVPAEVEAVVKAGTQKIADIGKEFEPEFQAVAAEVSAQLEKVAVPEEIKAALAEIDRQRALIQKYQQAKSAEIAEAIAKRKQAIQTEIDFKVQDVYASIEQRKRDIEIEFAGKYDDVDANIAKLKAEIIAETKAAGATAKGKHFMAVYVKGRVTWNTDMLDGMVAIVPQLSKARKEGEPSVTIRNL